MPTRTQKKARYPVKNYANIAVRKPTRDEVLELSLAQDTSMAAIVQRAMQCYRETGTAARDTEGVEALK
jgi:hypothetical protein